MASSLSCRLQAGQHVGVKALELPNAWEAPPPIALRVRGVPELPCWPQANCDLRDDIPCTTAQPVSPDILGIHSKLVDILTLRHSIATLQYPVMRKNETVLFAKSAVQGSAHMQRTAAVD